MTPSLRATTPKPMRSWQHGNDPELEVNPWRHDGLSTSFATSSAGSRKSYELLV
jgi:hypothetical protein